MTLQDQICYPIHLQLSLATSGNLVFVYREVNLSM